MSRLEKYQVVDSFTPMPDWDVTEKISEKDGSRYKLFKLERKNPTYWKMFLAILLTIVSPLFRLYSAEFDHRRNKDIADYWSGREVLRFKVDETKVRQQAKALASQALVTIANQVDTSTITPFEIPQGKGIDPLGSVEDVVEDFEELKKQKAELEKVEAQAKATLEDSQKKEYELRQTVESLREVEETKKGFEVQYRQEAEKAKRACERIEKLESKLAQALESARRVEEEAKKSFESTQKREIELEGFIRQARLAGENAQQQLEALGSQPITVKNVLEKERQTLVHLAAIYRGERVDVDEEGLVSTPAYANDWISTAWRTWMRQSSENLEAVKGIFSRVIASLEEVKDLRSEIHFILNAIDGLMTLKHDYLASRKHNKAKIPHEIAVASLGELKTLLWKKLESSQADEFRKYHPLARRMAYLWFQLKKDKGPINELYSFLREKKLDKTQERELLGFLDKALGMDLTQDIINQASSLEASMIDAPGAPMVLLHSLPYIQRKLLLFISLYDGEPSMNISLWREFLSQLATTEQVCQYVSKVGNQYSHQKKSIVSVLTKHAETYLTSLERQPEGTGVLVPVSFFYQNEDGKQGGHFAPISIIKRADGYYLFQHNAGPGTLSEKEDNGREWVGHTTVALGPYTREETKDVIVRGIELQMIQHSNQTEAVQGYQSLFNKDKLIKTDSIPKRSFQRIGNCAVRGFIEWIIFANQRAEQVDVVNAFIQFELFKSRNVYPKSPVEPLQGFPLLN
ncbi:MAG: hypothetical protein ACXWM7_04680 [Parachlamydiaceae bacterium]